ncbi:hypothetical protein ES702_01590 [subsurface metagenome]
MFYYHGQRNFTVGNDVWGAIIAWQFQQHSGLQRRESYSCETADIHKQEVVSSVKQEDLEQQARKVRQKEFSEQREAEREKILRTSKEAQKWNNFAKQEASKSLVHDGIIKRLGWTHDNEEKDERGIIW